MSDLRGSLERKENFQIASFSPCSGRSDPRDQDQSLTVDPTSCMCQSFTYNEKQDMLSCSTCSHPMEWHGHPSQLSARARKAKLDKIQEIKSVKQSLSKHTSSNSKTYESLSQKLLQLFQYFSSFFTHYY